VALPPDVREAAVSQVERYCDERVPAEARSDIRIEHAVRGNAITIVERRPPWSELPRRPADRPDPHGLVSRFERFLRAAA